MAGWPGWPLVLGFPWRIGLWDLRNITVWTIGLVGFFFATASIIYVMTRMVSPRIPTAGHLDIVAFHRQEGRKYIGFFAFVALVTIGANSLLGPVEGAIEWPAQNFAIAPMFVAAVCAAIFIRTAWIQVGALVVALVSWAVYFAVLQPPLSGNS